MLRDLSKKTWATVLGVVVFIVFLNVLFFYVSPDEVVALVGVENTYLVVFLIATLGGLNSITGGVLYASIATFAAGGASVFWLGIVGGIGITIGDLIMFTLLRTGVKALKDETSTIQQWVSWLRDKLRTVPDAVEYFLMYLILGFTPMPNDIMMLFMASAGYRYRVVVPLLLASDITIALVVAYFGEGLLSLF